MPRLTFIHATRAAIEPIEVATQKLWPDVETVSIMEEALSIDRQKSERLSKGLQERIEKLTTYAQGIGSDGILFTCSAFGKAIDAAAKKSDIPIMKPNEAMFDRAGFYGERVTMIYTFPPAGPSMEAEYYASTRSKDSKASLKSYFCAGALDAKRAGDNTNHDRLIARTAAKISDVDVIMLAQFSMASAAEEVRKQTKIPVLTSPEAAISAIRHKIETKR